MTPKRATLRDRNREAIAVPAAPVPPEQTPARPATPTARAQPEAAEQSASHTVTTSRRPAAAGERIPLSISVRPEEFEAAKAAYMADWMHEGRLDGFPKWLGDAIRQHAALSPEQRAQVEASRPPKQTKRGLKRAFLMDPRDLDILHQGIREDLTAMGRYSSEASWCADAMRLAVDRARERAGGTLPPAPARLPNRMPERL